MTIVNYSLLIMAEKFKFTVPVHCITHRPLYFKLLCLLGFPTGNPKDNQLRVDVVFVRPSHTVQIYSRNGCRWNGAMAPCEREVRAA